MIAVRPPFPFRAPANAAMRAFLETDQTGPAAAGFADPPGEPALVPADSVSWRIFKNPVSVFVGGVTAVLLELAEPRVRTGVWEHTRFRQDPRARIRRTGRAAMIAVYGARSSAEALIARVNRMHAQVRGHTPDGVAYAADDPELLTWVQATAAYGFVEAYQACVRPLAAEDRDRFYMEGQTTARLFGAVDAPASRAEISALFDAMRSRLEASPIIFEFLDIVRAAPILPFPVRALQTPMIKLAVAITPADVRDALNLGPPWLPSAPERAAVKLAARIAERVVLEESPAAQACRRLGLPEDWLWRRGADG